MGVYVWMICAWKNEDCCSWNPCCWFFNWCYSCCLCGMKINSLPYWIWHNARLWEVLNKNVSVVLMPIMLGCGGELKGCIGLPGSGWHCQCCPHPSLRINDGYFFQVL